MTLTHFRYNLLSILFSTILIIGFVHTDKATGEPSTPESENRSDTTNRDNLARQIYVQMVIKPLPVGRQVDGYYESLAYDAISYATKFESILEKSKKK